MPSDSISLGDIQPQNEPVRAERRDAAANRQLILETAQRLFAEEGVAAVNMADIAKAAGVGKGTLYRRFTNKGALCLAMLDEAFRAFQDEQLGMLRRLTAEHASYREQLNQILRATVTFTLDNLALMCEIEAGGLNPDRVDIHAPHFWLEMTVRGLMQAAVNAGEISDEVDVVYTASALMSLLNGRTLSTQLIRDGFSVEQVVSGILMLVQALPRG